MPWILVKPTDTLTLKYKDTNDDDEKELAGMTKFGGANPAPSIRQMLLKLKDRTKAFRTSHRCQRMIDAVGRARKAARAARTALQKVEADLDKHIQKTYPVEKKEERRKLAFGERELGAIARLWRGDDLFTKVLQRHFRGAYHPSQIKRMRDVFSKVADNLDSRDLVIEDTAQRGNGPEGYVDFTDGIRAKYADLLKDMEGMNIVIRATSVGDKANISIKFDLVYDKSVDFMARVVVHEASHKYAATVDKAYAYDRRYDALQTHEAVENADSYAYAAMSFLRGTLVAYDDLNGEAAAGLA